MVPGMLILLPLYGVRRLFTTREYFAISDSLPDASLAMAEKLTVPFTVGL